MKAEASGWLIRGSEGQRRQRPRLPFGVQHPHFLRNPSFTGEMALPLYRPPSGGCISLFPKTEAESQDRDIERSKQRHREEGKRQTQEPEEPEAASEPGGEAQCLGEGRTAEAAANLLFL